jgi:hypothetical protein
MNRFWGMLSLLLLSEGVSSESTAPWFPEPGIYTNEEEVYFDKEAGKDTDYHSYDLTVTDQKVMMTGLQRNGRPIIRPRETIEDALKYLKPLPDGRVELLVDGEVQNDGNSYKAKFGPIYLRRGRPATCWVAILRDKPKPDGKPDWYFARDVKLHDQGGQVWLGGQPDFDKDTGAQQLMIRMRNVVWPPNKDGTPSSNRPSLVLYVHKAENPDRAESYAWADPGAARIGINLRWMQASCTIDGVEKASEVNASTFRG